MCQFCAQHGDGKKWYLTMSNYSRELIEQDARVDYMLDFANRFQERMPRKLQTFEHIKHSPLRELSKPLFIRSQKQNHFGQVVPIEEIELILDQVDAIARVECVCRMVTTGRKDARYCYLLTDHPRLAAELDDSFNLEYLTAEEAGRSVAQLDKEGLIHSVWTFKSPYIGAICNCDQDCIAYRIGHAENYFKLMFRAEWVAEVELDICNGCKNCLRQCQFGAMRFSATNKKVSIDPRLCYGCGLCRAACNKDAIRLEARDNHPAARGIW